MLRAARDVVAGVGVAGVGALPPFRVSFPDTPSVPCSVSSPATCTVATPDVRPAVIVAVPFETAM